VGKLKVIDSTVDLSRVDDSSFMCSRSAWLLHSAFIRTVASELLKSHIRQLSVVSSGMYYGTSIWKDVGGRARGMSFFQSSNKERTTPKSPVSPNYGCWLAGCRVSGVTSECLAQAVLLVIT
jgi:hypothetical protein